MKLFLTALLSFEFVYLVAQSQIILGLSAGPTRATMSSNADHFTCLENIKVKGDSVISADFVEIPTRLGDGLNVTASLTAITRRGFLWGVSINYQHTKQRECFLAPSELNVAVRAPSDFPFVYYRITRFWEQSNYLGLDIPIGYHSQFSGWFNFYFKGFVMLNTYQTRYRSEDDDYNVNNGEYEETHIVTYSSNLFETFGFGVGLEAGLVFRIADDIDALVCVPFRYHSQYASGPKSWGYRVPDYPKPSKFIISYNPDFLNLGLNIGIRYHLR